jgi:hypothetical protein
LTLDLRLRMLASVFQIQSCWPQAFIASKVGPELSQRDYSIAVLRMFCSRRDFISLSVYDLLVLTDQGERWINTGFTRLREVLSARHSDFSNSWSVVREYLEVLYGRGHCQLGAVLEFFTYLLEGLLRHPQCPQGFATSAADELGKTLGGEKDAFTGRLREFSDMAVARSNGPLRPVRVRAQVVYCCNPPAVRHGLTNGPDPLAGATSEPAPIHRREGESETTLHRPTEQDVD